MMKSILKQAVLALSVIALTLSIVSCQSERNDPNPQGNLDRENLLFAEPTELSIAISTSSSWPYREDWKMWQYFREATGATFKITTIPALEMDTKVALMMADRKSLPDLLHLWNKLTVDTYAASGALIPLSTNLDKLPNYTAFWNTIPEEERNEIMAQRTSGDGEIYSAPVYGTQTVYNRRTWMYRKDIFEKHRLTPPKTYDELYQTAKKLKELYPESYPLCFRVGMMQLEVLAPSWKNDYYPLHPYYDFELNEWKYGVQDPILKDMIKYFLKLYNEGLVPPDYLKMNAKSWEELMSTDRGFMTLDYIVRIDFFNLSQRENNPEYTLALMAPPIPDVPTGRSKMMRTSPDFYGYTIPNTGREQGIDNALKLVDWMYTDEAAEILSWGREGETYKIEDGKKKFILPAADAAPNATYGVGTYGVFQRIHEEAYEAIYSEEQVAACREAMQYIEPRVNPTFWLPLNEEEADRVNVLRPELSTYIEENISKFLLGQKPLSDWDSFQQGLKEMGSEELLAIYDTAYSRVMNK